MIIWRCIAIAYTLAIVITAAFGITSRFEVAALGVAAGVTWWRDGPPAGRRTRPPR